MKTRVNQEKLLDEIATNRSFRKELAMADINWFFTIYFSNYIKYESAPFHREMFSLITNEQNPIVAITAFRSSAKSTICSLVFPIWAIVGPLRKKNIVIVTLNQTRSEETLNNIKYEFETNDLLIEDFNPWQGKTNKWTENAIVIPKYDAMIKAVSVSEGIRGIRYKQHRPEIIICDDIEDVPSTQSSENRKKLWQFIYGELVPAGEKGVRQIYIGNKVHNDSVMMRLKRAIESGKVDGVYKEYPLVDSKGKILWPGLYSNKKEIKKLKAKYASDIDYLREQMLKILPEGDAIIKPEDIHYYDELPNIEPEFYFTSVDPAFSELDTSDPTAIIVGAVYKMGKQLKVYIFARLVNKNLKVPDWIEEIRNIKRDLGDGALVRIFVEGGGPQKGLVQMLQYEGIPAEEIHVDGKDKRARLHITSPWIKNGVINFPRAGNEELINQILYFGSEKHDDLVDAFTLASKAILDSERNSVASPIQINLSEPFRDSVVRKVTTSSGQDWADVEDQEIFGRLKLRNPTRIFG